METAVLYKGRIVIPLNLQMEILDILHSGHQGAAAMGAIAADAVFWLGMWDQINKRRQECSSCDAVAPPQPASPPWPLPSPEFPFQMVSTDYFSMAGKEFYIIADRYSGWLSIYKAGGNGAMGFI